MVAKRGINNREGDSTSLEVGVGRADGADEIRSTHLAPDEVVRVIDDTHLVGLAIAYAKLDDRFDRAAAVSVHGNKISPRDNRVPLKRVSVLHVAGPRLCTNVVAATIAGCSTPPAT